MPDYVLSSIHTVLSKNALSNPKHTLHITLSTNHATKEAARRNLPTATDIPFWVGGRLILSTQMYDIDPLGAWSIPAGIAPKPSLGFRMHVSTHYFCKDGGAVVVEPPLTVIIPPAWGVASPVTVNTESRDPSKWFEC